jgi:hypothetical protein
MTFYKFKENASGAQEDIYLEELQGRNHSIMEVQIIMG